MGYSQNEAAVKKMQKLLDQMVEAQTDLTWPTSNAHMLGYWLREAMTVAKKKGIKPYDDLKDKFIIRNRGTAITAELKHVDTLQALQSAMAKMVLENIETLPEVVGAAISHKAKEMYFPDAHLRDDDLVTLHKWAEANGYFMLVADSGLTITKTDPGELKWMPTE